MKSFYFTFGSGHVHPTTGEPLEDRYVRIDAASMELARSTMVQHFGLKWSSSYESPSQAGIERWGLVELPRLDWPPAEEVTPEKLQAMNDEIGVIKRSKALAAGVEPPGRTPITGGALVVKVEVETFNTMNHEEVFTHLIALARHLQPPARIEKGHAEWTTILVKTHYAGLEISAHAQDTVPGLVADLRARLAERETTIFCTPALPKDLLTPTQPPEPKPSRTPGAERI